MTASAEYDATGLLCPLPVLRANRKLRELPVGGLLTVRATDPAAEQDFPAYCKQTGHELVSSWREGDVLIFVIRKDVNTVTPTGAPAQRGEVEGPLLRYKIRSLRPPFGLRSG